MVGGIWVRNVGNGLALIDSEKSWLLGHGLRGTAPGELGQYVRLFTDDPVLPQGDVTNVTFEATVTSAAWVDLTPSLLSGRGVVGNGFFAFDIVYTDSAEGRSTRARFMVASRDGTDNGGWVVYETQYFDGDSVEPSHVVKRRGS